MNDIARKDQTILQLPKPDKLLILLFALFVGLALWDEPQAMASLWFVWDAVLGVFPFLMLSVLIAAHARASSLDRMIAKAFTGHLAVMIISAAVVGAFSPFCSCGVIPLVAALLAMGVPLSAVMAFWLASPIMDPTMFVMTMGTLGFEFAAFKAVAAVGMGLVGGFSVAALQRFGAFRDPLRQSAAGCGCGAPDVSGKQPIIWRFWGDAARRLMFREATLSNAFFLGKWLVFAFTLESLMVAYMPEGLVMSALGGEGAGPIFLATVIGVPAYLNGYAALPLVSGLIGEGMEPAAGMAFLLAGGVTSIPASIAVFALARLPVFVAYLVLALLGTLIFSFGFQLVM
ncbi:permease [Kordiimonas lipolytica]|uniref:Permease n=1 Tax=Kordiimonas lipolytica TaxID=1662421 RepID=A0ABV8U515_9PROT|nr:permease [Kordiimonas lipolytica]